jgi:hypothetical protein
MILREKVFVAGKFPASEFFRENFPVHETDSRRRLLVFTSFFKTMTPQNFRAEKFPGNFFCPEFFALRKSFLKNFRA